MSPKLTIEIGNKLAEDLWVRGAGHLLGAQGLVSYAKDEAAQCSAEDPDRYVFNGKYSASIHLLVGYAFELLLKAAYLIHGGAPKKLQGGIGHDLVAALDAAEAAGFQSTVANLRWIVENLREPHHTHQFRYGGLADFEMPLLQHSIPALEALVFELGAPFVRVT
jgi:hypothetical protein